jgi:GNAT superfamily N-acetyltransferase
VATRRFGPSGERVNGNVSISLSDGYTDVPRGKIAAVVTCLEMLALPSPRPDPPHPPWKLRRVVDPDLGWFRDLYRRVGQDWLWFSRLTLSDDALAAIIRDCSIELYALEHLGCDEGLLELDFRQAEVCELSFFGVTAGLIGKGAGRWLMNRALELAWSRPIRRLWVHTCTLDHPSALTFYLRSGFRAFRRQIEIADDPRTVGVLPRTAAPGIPIIDR